MAVSRKPLPEPPLVGIGDRDLLRVGLGESEELGEGFRLAAERHRAGVEADGRLVAVEGRDDAAMDIAARDGGGVLV